MTHMRKSSKKKVLKKNDDQRILDFPSCTCDVRAFFREAGRNEWIKWMTFNAGIILSDQEVRQLTEADREMYPMKWLIQTKTRIHQERATMFLPAVVSLLHALV